VPQIRAASLPPDVETYLSRFDRFYLAPARGVDGMDHRGYQVRAEIYDGILRLLKAGGPMPDSQTPATALGALKATWDRVDAQTSLMNQQLAAITPGSLSSDEQLRELCRSAAGVTSGISLRLKIAAVSTAMRTAPADEAGFAQLVRASAQSSPAKLPTVPLAQAPDQEADPQFDPIAAKTVLGEWSMIGQFLQGDIPAEAHGDTDAIAQQFSNSQPALRQYVDAYRHYWADLIPARLTVKLTSWDAFFRDGGKPQVWKSWEVNAPIKELGTACVLALSTMEDAAPQWKQELQITADRQQLEDATRQIDDPLFQGQCEKILAAWRKLAADANFDPLAARDALLDQTPQLWRDQFLLSDKQGFLAARFWSDLNLELLRVLAAQAMPSVADTADKSLQALRNLSRFPLARPRTGDRPLTSAEISAARAALATLQKADRPHESAALPGATLRIGAAVGIPAIDAGISPLLGVDLTNTDAQWILQLSRLIPQLPSDKPMVCTISVAGGQERQSVVRGDPPDWYSVVLEQGAATSGEVQLQPMPDSTQKLAACVCPGDGLSFKFFQHPTHDQETPAAGPVIFGGSWQPLALIFCPGAQSISPRKWLVPFPIPPRQQPILPLVVEFDRDIPPADQWPAAREQ
jgi:hypothetical protein